MERRFFVTVFAPDEAALSALGKYGLDLFPSSSRKRKKLAIDGLLGEAQIKKLERAGYRVEVRKEHVEQAQQSGLEAQSSPIPIMDDKEWLKAFKRRKRVK